jgi:subtilisin family serine protease
VVTAAEARIGGRPLSPNGTSYSAALVSGVIALVRAKYPNLPAADVVRQVLATARPAGPDGRDVEYGYGIVDPVTALTATLPTASPAPAPAPAPGRPLWLVPALVVLPLALTGTVLAWWWRKRTR